MQSQSHRTDWMSRCCFVTDSTETTWQNGTHIQTLTVRRLSVLCSVLAMNEGNSVVGSALISIHSRTHTMHWVAPAERRLPVVVVAAKLAWKPVLHEWNVLSFMRPSAYARGWEWMNTSARTFPIGISSATLNGNFWLHSVKLNADGGDRCVKVNGFFRHSNDFNEFHSMFFGLLFFFFLRIRFSTSVVR